jgi:hypothetical protein
MIQEKYIVKVPIPDSEPVEYKEFRFSTREEVCKFLNIRLYTFHSICNGTIQYAHADTMRLYGIIIERIDITYRQQKYRKDKISKKFASKLLTSVN